MNAGLVLWEVAGRGVLVAAAALAIAWPMRNRMGSWRHSVCALALTALALLPLAIWLPRWRVEISGWSGQNVDHVSTVSPWLWLVIGIWLAGAILCVSKVAWGIWRLRRWTLAAEEVKTGEVAEELETACRILDLSRSPRLLLAGPGVMPVAFGWNRGVVLLPEEALDWPPDRLRLVLLHELGHLKRRDTWLQLLGLAACAVHWFNPLAWLLHRVLRHERELACDELVVRAGVPPLGYARHLLDFVTARQNRLAMAAALGGSDLKARIQRLAVLARQPVRKAPRWLVAAVCLFGAAALAAAIFLQPAAATESTAEDWTPEEVETRWEANPFPEEAGSGR